MAGGQQIDVGQGNVVYSEETVDAITGSASTTEAGTNAPGTVIRLRSRKVGGGTSSFLLTGQFSAIQQETPVKQVSALLSTPTVTSAVGSFGPSRSKVLSGSTLVGSQTNIGPTPSSDWNPGDFSFTDGVANSYQLLTPSGHQSGGRFFVNSGTLPSTITLSDTGLLQYDGTTGLSTVNVTFGYTEPYAFPTLSLYANKTGDFPYMATLFANEGTVPAGRYVYSPDDSNLRGTTISTWPDGSSRVIVLHSHLKAVTASNTYQVNVRLAPTSFSNGTALTESFIQTVVSSVSVNFGGGVQTLNIASASASKIWWSNSECICARYVLSCNKGVMEAQIDIHAFANGANSYAFVEILIENGKVNFGLATPPAMPGPNRETYTNATIAVNGTTILTISPPTPGTFAGLPYYTTGTHEKFRAFYIGSWVRDGVVTAIRGASDPWIEVIHDKNYIQQLAIWPGAGARAKSYNPNAIFSRDQGYSRNTTGTVAQPYSVDFYQPWDIGRFRGANMGNAGLISQIQHQEWRYIQGPDKETRRAVIATTLCYHAYYINYRDSTGDVPSFARIGTRYRGQYIPVESGVDPDYKPNHTAGQGLMGFFCQPSPCFIELCQKKAIWDGTIYSTVPVMQFANGGIRAYAWYARHLIQALYITPDWHSWKASGEDALYQHLKYIDQWRTSGAFTLNVIGYSRPDRLTDQRSQSDDGAEFEVGFWQTIWVYAEIHKTVKAKMLTDSTKLTEIVTLRDWALTGAVRMVNEQAHTGAWRYQCQYDSIGARGCTSTDFDGIEDGSFYYRNGTDHQGYLTWDLKAQARVGYPPPSVTGRWMVNFDQGLVSAPEDSPTKFGFDSYNPCVSANNQSEYDYATTVWPWICMAAEEDISGASTMWSTVMAGITNWTQWLDGFASYVEDGYWPRNYTLDR